MSTTKKRMGDEGLRIDIPVTPIRKVKLFNDTKLKGGGGSAGKPRFQQPKAYMYSQWQNSDIVQGKEN